MRDESTNGHVAAIHDGCKSLSENLLLFAKILTKSQTDIQRTTAEQPFHGKPESLLAPKQVAGILNVSMSLLEKWRRDGRGPSWIRLEGQRAVRYRHSDVMKFILSKRIRSGEENV